MKLPRIKECKEGNCVFHFPQFTRYELKDATESLELMVKYQKNCKIPDELIERFRAALMSNDIIACAEINNESRPEFYLDLRGGVARFRPCCR